MHHEINTIGQEIFKNLFSEEKPMAMYPSLSFQKQFHMYVCISFRNSVLKKDKDVLYHFLKLKYVI